jgi:glycosyltransferase involved in cell wall biosynthesis
MTRLVILLAVRDEAERIGRCLDSLSEFRDAGDALAVADDGSTDDTAAILRERGVAVLSLPAVGRGWAYRRCWEAIPPDAEICLVAQADMIFPAGARRVILETLAGPRPRDWGFFRQRVEPSRPALRLIAWGNELRARWLGLPYGDQGVFFRREALERAGSFPAQGRLEDLELARRLRSVAGRPGVASGAAIRLSARHWERRGVIPQTLANWRAATGYLWRASASEKLTNAPERSKKR